MSPIAEVGSAFVTVMPSARGFGRSLNSQVSGDIDSSGRTMGSRFGTAFKAAGVAVLGGAALLGGFLKGAMDEARDAQKVGALTNAVIKSTGGVANVTAAQVDKLATSLSAKTGIDDEAIAAGQNMLLTFTNVRNEVGRGNDIFNQATVAVQDMGAAFGGDAVSNSKMLGKALNDPVKGVSALTRVGVSFTQQQKDQISTLVESGRVVDAQKIILGELTKQTGGAAEATATAGDKFKVAFGNLQESVGTALLPLFDRLLEAGASLAVFLTNNIGPGIIALNGYIAPVVAKVEEFFAALSAGSGGASFFTSLVGTFNTVRGAIGGIISAFAPFVSAVLPSIISAGQKIAAAVLPAIQSVASVVMTQLVPAFQRILPILAPVVSFLVGVFGSAVVGAIQGVAQAVRGIITVIAGVINVIVALVTGDWRAAWDGLKQIVTGAVNAVIGIIRAWLNIGILNLFRSGVLGMRSLWTGLWNGIRGIAQKGAAAVQGLAAGFFRFLVALVTSAVRTYISLWRNLFSALMGFARAGWAAIRGAFTSALATIRNVVNSALIQVVGFFRNAFLTAVRLVIGAFNTMRNAVANGVGSVISLVASLPGRMASALGNLGSTLFNAGASLIQGLINGITSKISAVTAKMSELASKIKGFVPGSPIKTGPLKAWNNTGPTGPGGQLVGLLAKGVENSSALDSAMGRLTSRVSIPAVPSLAVSAAGGYGGTASSGVNLNGITIYANNPDEAMRSLRREQEKALTLARLA